MVKSISKARNWNGEICGDSAREFQTSSEKKEKQVKDYGDIYSMFFIYSYLLYLSYFMLLS